jgi:predicted dienelactone hydrolase
MAVVSSSAPLAAAAAAVAAAGQQRHGSSRAAIGIPDLRRRVRDLLMAAGRRRNENGVLLPAPALTRRTERRDGLRQETWRVHSQLGEQGAVPVLCVQQKLTEGGVPRRPVVVMLHGTGGSKEDMLPLLDRYARAGYIACAVDSRHHGERSAHPGAYTAALMSAFRANQRGDPNAAHPFMFDTAFDMIKVLDWLCTRRDVDPQRIGMTVCARYHRPAAHHARAPPTPTCPVNITCLALPRQRTEGTRPLHPGRLTGGHAHMARRGRGRARGSGR